MPNISRRTSYCRGGCALVVLVASWKRVRGRDQVVHLHRGKAFTPQPPPQRAPPICRNTLLGPFSAHDATGLVVTVTPVKKGNATGPIVTVTVASIQARTVHLENRSQGILADIVAFEHLTGYTVGPAPCASTLGKCTIGHQNPELDNAKESAHAIPLRQARRFMGLIEANSLAMTAIYTSTFGLQNAAVIVGTDPLVS
ncbi:hypothetical protein B0H13DRAFT_1897613 [Mycena leptocephala]|nr:hypothetical protein B0H13DRAFT_1897613 [Mycena leptocephala]